MQSPVSSSPVRTRRSQLGTGTVWQQKRNADECLCNQDHAFCFLLSAALKLGHGTPQSRAQARSDVDVI